MDSSAWDDRYAATDQLWSVAPNPFVRDRLKDAEPGSGLDLGAGEGRNAIWLQNLGWDMTAVDFSPVAVDRGKAISSDVDFEVSDVLEWTSTTTFDLILVAYLHLSPHAMAPLLGRLGGWLTDGGELFLIGHDRTNIENGHGGPSDPTILWDADEILAMIDADQVIEAGVVRRPVETDEGTVFARDTLVRVRATPRTELS